LRSRVQIPIYKWEPSPLVELDNNQRAMLHMDRVVKQHPRFFINDQQFRAPRANKNMLTDDGGIAFTYLEGGRKRIAYGEIQGIWEHHLYVDAEGQPVDSSPVMTLLEVEWMEPMTDETGLPKMAYGGRVPVVGRNPDSEWNRDFRFEDGGNVLPYNVIFRKKDWFNEECVEYVVLSRPPGRTYLKKR
jgi:hypothetical protein